MKTCISKSGDGVFTYSHTNKPLGQSERAYYLSFFFIKFNVGGRIILHNGITFSLLKSIANSLLNKVIARVPF